ncbi:hypothetical protein NFI96_026646 [Prochilodus magdalenae]|nr:hypothetical protein NFI96_026646 [Prochilodus magdalenae]
MGKSKEISQDIRKRIVDLHKSGSSLGAISRCLKVPRSSVQTIIRKYKKDGNVQPSYRSGRKKVLCPRDERALVRSVHIKPRAKAKDLVNMMAEAERLVVTGGHVVSVYTGKDVTLNCSVDSHIPPEMLEVSWKKVNPQIPVLIFQEGDILTESTHERYRDRVEFFGPEEIQKGNFSLRLKELRTEDKGLYICEVFSGEFAANTTVEVQQLGFPSLYTWILILCTLAFVVPVVLCYSASTSLKNQDYSGRALLIHYTLVCCPSIAMCLAFILWGVIEGFFSEAATCSALNLLRILSLFWIAPYLDTFKGNLRRYINRSAFAIEYAVITFLAYLGTYTYIYISNETEGSR